MGTADKPDHALALALGDLVWRMSRPEPNWIPCYHFMSQHEYNRSRRSGEDMRWAIVDQPYLPTKRNLHIKPNSGPYNASADRRYNPAHKSKRSPMVPVWPKEWQLAQVA